MGNHARSATTYDNIANFSFATPSFEVALEQKCLFLNESLALLEYYSRKPGNWVPITVSKGRCPCEDVISSTGRCFP